MTVRQVLPEGEPTVDGYGDGNGYDFGYDPGRAIIPGTVIPGTVEPVTGGGRHRGARGGHRSPQRGGYPIARGSHRARRRNNLTSVAVLGLAATVAGGGFAAVGLLASGSAPIIPAGALTLHASAVSSLSGAGNPEGAATAMPGASAMPAFTFASVGASTRSATSKTSAKRPATATSAAASTSPTATPSSVQSTQSAPTPSSSSSSPSNTTPTQAPTSATPTPQTSSSTATTPVSNGGAASCTNPVYTTSSLYGTYTDVPYYVANDMWNVGSSNASQTLDVCSANEWSVTANISGGGTSVKTYPNGQRDFANAPTISSLNSVTSTFAETSPGTGTYETAYDIWLNAVANPSAGSDEVMIWTENHGQIPGGSPQATVTFDGVTYTAWKGNGNYFAFVANSTFTAGSLNLLDFFKWLMNKGWIPGNSTLVQVDYGVEVVATNGSETFHFSNFSVNAS